MEAFNEEVLALCNKHKMTWTVLCTHKNKDLEADNAHAQECTMLAFGYSDIASRVAVFHLLLQQVKLYWEKVTVQLWKELWEEKAKALLDKLFDADTWVTDLREDEPDIFDSIRTIFNKKDWQ